MPVSYTHLQGNAASGSLHLQRAVQYIGEHYIENISLEDIAEHTKPVSYTHLAVNYGVPQFRERFVLIGSRDNEDIFLPIPTHFQMHQSEEYQWQTVRSVIEDLEFDHGECADVYKRQVYL